MAKKIPEKIIQQVVDRSGKSCEICGSNNMCQIHHIVFRSQTLNNDAKNLIMLCWEHHLGNYGVHGKYGTELNTKLKKQLQDKYFNMGLSEEDVRLKMGGRLYT